MTRCPDCDLALATEWELNEHEEDCPCCERLCWRIANPGGFCYGPSIDWRPRAEAAESSAVHWAEAYARECRRP